MSTSLFGYGMFSDAAFDGKKKKKMVDDEDEDCEVESDAESGVDNTVVAPITKKKKKSKNAEVDTTKAKKKRKTPAASRERRFCEEGQECCICSRGGCQQASLVSGYRHSTGESCSKHQSHQRLSQAH